MIAEIEHIRNGLKQNISHCIIAIDQYGDNLKSVPFQMSMCFPEMLNTVAKKFVNESILDFFTPFMKSVEDKEELTGVEKHQIETLIAKMDEIAQRAILEGFEEHDLVGTRNFRKARGKAWAAYWICETEWYNIKKMFRVLTI